MSRQGLRVGWALCGCCGLITGHRGCLSLAASETITLNFWGPAGKHQPSLPTGAVSGASAEVVQPLAGTEDKPIGLRRPLLLVWAAGNEARVQRTPGKSPPQPPSATQLHSS